jgi:hypothetical protein
MWRLIVFVFGATTLGLVGAYFWTGRSWYLQWAKRLFVLGLMLGLVFFMVLLVSRLI